MIMKDDVIWFKIKTGFSMAIFKKQIINFGIWIQKCNKFLEIDIAFWKYFIKIIFDKTEFDDWVI